MLIEHKYFARSLSDPNGDKGALGFQTKEEAENHKNRMNVLKEEYDHGGSWNKDYWGSKPEPWIVFEPE